MHPHPPCRRRDYSEPRPWQPLSDAEWDELPPFVLVQNGPGRPLRDARARMDAIFWTAASGQPWHTLPSGFGRADTVHRHFRRLAHAGLWERLLRALARPDAPAALRALEHWVCCACRRATRIRVLRIIALARRLGFLSALKGPSWLLPDPDLSETVFRGVRRLLARLRAAPGSVHRSEFITARRLLRMAQGRARIPRCLQPA